MGLPVLHLARRSPDALGSTPSGMAVDGVDLVIRLFLCGSLRHRGIIVGSNGPYVHHQWPGADLLPASWHKRGIRHSTIARGVYPARERIHVDQEQNWTGEGFTTVIRMGVTGNVAASKSSERMQRRYEDSEMN